MEEKRRSYDTADIEVTYDVKRCIHAAECTKNLPSVFNASTRPWIQPEGASADEIATVIHKCPTGALQYRRKDGNADEAAPTRNQYRLAANGPLYLKGEINFVDDTGEVISTDTRVALCRCGASKNKPYCDNSHKDIDWSAEGDTPLETGEEISGESTGKFIVQAFANGPLVCQGTVTAIRKDGSTIGITQDPAFCRCGGSSNKPFCDGTHNKIGFQSE